MSDSAPITAPTPTLPTLPMDAVAIRRILPHRYPFLLIDRVVEFVPGQHIRSQKFVSQNEPYFAGHFPTYPVMPGVLQVEALAQTGAIVLLLAPENRGKLAMLTGIDTCKFRRPVMPGELMELLVDDFRVRRSFGKSHGVVTVGGEVTCETEISFGLVDWDGPSL